MKWIILYNSRIAKELTGSCTGTNSNKMDLFQIKKCTFNLIINQKNELRTNAKILFNRYILLRIPVNQTEISTPSITKQPDPLKRVDFACTDFACGHRKHTTAFSLFPLLNK